MRFRLSVLIPAPLALALCAAAPLALVPVAAQAQAGDPAAQTVEALDAGLIAILRAGSAAGPAGRARIIAPVVDRSLDLPLMTRLSVGPAWLQMSAKDQADLVAAFRGMTIAQYAHNFDAYSGQRFVMAPQVETRGIDKLVRTTLITPGEDSEKLDYRLREDGGPGSGKWKIVDIYYRNAISQLATRRSDFAAVLARGGATALIAHLNQLAK